MFVVANTILLSMTGLVNTDNPPYSTLNTIFTFVFTIDATLKIFAYGVAFFADIMNLFDAFVVTTSLIEFTF